MKAIFLDVDGVLNAFTRNGQQLEFSNGQAIDEQKVMLLAEIVAKTGAKLVLHSGWRFWFDDSLWPVQREAEKLVQILRNNKLELFDKTPDLTTEQIRETKRFSLVKAKEISAWLDAHPEASRYLVLDDLDLHDPVLAAFQIRTDSAVGLTLQDVEQAIRILNH